MSGSPNFSGKKFIFGKKLVVPKNAAEKLIYGKNLMGGCQI